MSIRKIFLIRHCRPKIIENVSICLGRKDIPLSKEGIDEAGQLKKYFSNIGLSGIYSSPLIRARHTAEIIADKKMNVIIKDGFSELNIGRWDGMSFAEIKEKYPETNIVPIDYDPGISMVNQLNRIKLMLSVAQKDM